MNSLPLDDPRVSVVPWSVASADTAVAALRNLAGLDVLVDVPHGASRWCEVGSTSAGVRILLVEIGRERYQRYAQEFGRAALLWFRADDLELVVTRARAADVRVVEPPQPAPWRDSWRWTRLADAAGTGYGVYQEG